MKYLPPSGPAVCVCGQPAEWCLNPLLWRWEWICYDCYYEILEVT